MEDVCQSFTQIKEFGGISYLVVTMISKNIILTLYFTKNSFGGGQIFDN